MEAFVEELRALKETVTAEQKEITELKSRLSTLESPQPSKIQIIPHETVVVKPLGDMVYQLTRVEAGMTAFSIVDSPISCLTITLDAKCPPEFVYFGLSPQKNEAVVEDECYIINNAGKARIPGFGWKDLQEGFMEEVSAGCKFCFEIGETCFLTVDDGRRISMFSKPGIERWHCIIGIFGEGTITARINE